MRMKACRFVGPIFLLGLLGANAYSRPMRMPGKEPILDLMDHADLVFRGQLLDVSHGPSAGYVGTVQVERLYKGNPSTRRIVLTFSSNPACPNPEPPQPIKQALFFIKTTGAVASLSNCEMGILATVAGISKNSGGDSGSQLLKDDLEASLKTAGSDEKIIALHQLVGLKAKETIPVIAELTKSQQDPLLDLTAVWALTELGDYSELTRFDELIKRKIPHALFLWWNIAGAIASITDKRATPGLIALTASDELELVRSSTYALRQIKDPAAVSRMISLLDSNDEQVRYDAMMGLVSVERHVMPRAPNTSLFHSNSQGYIQVWKNWWQTTGVKKYSQ